jgi:hypothetical protein
MEYIHFEVASFETSYHAILRKPTLARFMVIPSHTYLVLKMPTPNGVLSIYGDVKTSHFCEMENSDLLSKNTILVAELAKKIPLEEPSIPENDSTIES